MIWRRINLIFRRKLKVSGYVIFTHSHSNVSGGFHGHFNKRSPFKKGQKSHFPIGAEEASVQSLWQDGIPKWTSSPREGTSTEFQKAVDPLQRGYSGD